MSRRRNTLNVLASVTLLAAGVIVFQPLASALLPMLVFLIVVVVLLRTFRRS